MASSTANRQRASSMGVDRAIEVFLHGFSFTRSFTHPYVPERIGPLWVVRDGPRKSGNYRREEWVAYSVERMLRDDRTALQGTRSSRTAPVAVLTASHTGAKLYPVVGYRQIATLYLFTPRKR